MKKLFIAITLFTTALFAGSQGSWYDEDRNHNHGDQTHFALYACENQTGDIAIEFNYTFSGGIGTIGGINNNDYYFIEIKNKDKDVVHVSNYNDINFDIDYIPEYSRNINVKLDFDKNLINTKGEITKDNLYIRFTSKPKDEYSDRMIILITDLTQKTTDAINLKCARKY